VNVKQIILGTAGHIDHGKTELIKRLTGIDTDRLKEEKERGITIELGFAYLKLDNGVDVGIIDVPGHEKFVKNMLAGAGGIDLVLLVIAADEGVMPQTREHLAICELLRIKSGFVALTKSDLVDKEWLQMVREEIASFLKGTFLEGKPIVPVSAKTGEGIDELKSTIQKLAEEVEAKSADGPFVYPIDRVFIMKGFGTVVTGTVVSGRIRVDEKIEVLPGGIEGKVRGIQVHNKASQEAIAGQRAAINLQGIEKSDIRRGEVIGRPGKLKPSFILDATLSLIKDSPYTLKNRQRIRFHLGSGEIMARIVLLDREEMKPGEEGYVQIRLERPTTALAGNNYVIRSYSPMITIGGGEILHASTHKHKRFDEDTLERLKTLKEGSYGDIVESHIFEAGFQGMSLDELLVHAPSDGRKLKESLQELVKQKKIIELKGIQSFIHQEKFEEIKKILSQELEAFHKKFPLKPGMSKEELRSKVSMISDRTYSFMIETLLSQKLIVVEKDQIRLSSHRVQLGKEQEELKEKIEKEYLAAGFMTPNPEDLYKKFSLNDKRFMELTSLLLKEGRLVRIKEKIFFHSDNLSKIEQALRDFLEKNREITAAQFRDILNISRKYAIPLLEYFDAKRVTLRVGDKRVLRGKS
jgi:selenocysteine-specific elongation factor